MRLSKNERHTCQDCGAVDVTVNPKLRPARRAMCRSCNKGITGSRSK